MEINYIRYSADTSDDDITNQLVECYRNVFADPPWNEWLKCSICGKYWGRKDIEYIKDITFRHCGQPLVDFWGRKTVLSDIKNEIKSGTSSCWLALDQMKVIGFCWGYPSTTSDISKKMGIPIDFSPLQLSDSFNQPLALQDEVGVLAPYRGKKIAKELVRLRNQDFLEMGLSCGIVRTREAPEPSITYLWYSRIGYHVLARYPDDDGRVVMGIRLAKII